MILVKLTSGVWINVDAVAALEPIEPENLEDGQNFKTLVVMGSPGQGGYADDRSIEAIVALLRDAGGYV